MNINFSDTYNNNLIVSGLSDDLSDFSIVRQIPDTRDFSCPRIFPNLANFKHKVSIIITYHNESPSILYLTINSIVKRTPVQYLQEIIIIDYCNEDAGLVKNIQHHFELSNIIKAIRNPVRLGLIKSRNLGAKISTGDYLLFLDSHYEVNEQWLEALLSTIKEANNSRLALSPVLDSIDMLTKEYKATASLIKGGFDWNLHFHWIARDETLNPILPFRSPTFAGGVFLISRNWFFKLKAFNTRLETWGGESLEFSLKLWLCGGGKGEIKIVPCSRVGHIFRKEHIFQFPNNNGQHVYLRYNSKIIAEAWLEQFKYIFYNHKPEARMIFINDTRVEDKHFKAALNCQRFEWYLNNIFPELRPFENYTASGLVTSSTYVSDNLCLHHEFLDSQTSTLIMCNCLTSNITLWFHLKNKLQLQTSKGLCLNVMSSKSLDVDNRQFEIVMESCFWPAQQNWQRFGLHLRHTITGLCLEITVDYNLTVNRCRRQAVTQYFLFEKEIERF